MERATSQTIDSKQDKFHRGVILFNAGEFFKAHEVWEEIWLASGEPEKTFLQGMIQLSAAFHHYSRGNRAGTQSLVAAAVEKLGKFPADYLAVNLAALRMAVREWAAAPRNHPGCVPVPPPRIVLS